jgi:hypothetical protein
VGLLARALQLASPIHTRDQIMSWCARAAILTCSAIWLSPAIGCDVPDLSQQKDEMGEIRGERRGSDSAGLAVR